jgi:hypothetical protein
MELISIAVGLLLLLLGRKIFWLFVGLAGFLCGFQGVQMFFSDQAALGFIFGLLVGVVGVFVAVFFQRISFAIGGFFAGGYLSLAFCSHLGIEEPSKVLFIIVGFIAAVVALMWMDWAIILLSASAGAGAIVVNIALLSPPWSFFVFLLLVLIGCVVQGRALQGGLPPPS